MTSGLKLFLDAVPPRPVVKYVSPNSISPDGAGGANSATLRFAGPTRRARLLVYRTDLRRPRLVAARSIPRDESTVRWDGRVTGRRPAAAGSYLLVVRAQDAVCLMNTRSAVKWPAEALRALPRLRMATVCGIGTDAFDLTVAPFDFSGPCFLDLRIDIKTGNQTFNQSCSLSW
jgi:hypothetical protein